MKKLTNKALEKREENNALWKSYIVSVKCNNIKRMNVIEAEFLKINQDLLWDYVRVDNTREYNMYRDYTVEYSDMKQMLSFNYILQLRAAAKNGAEEYPINAMQIAVNETKKELNDCYSPMGEKVSYGTRKRHQREGKTYWEKDFDQYDFIACGSDEDKVERIFRPMIECQYSTAPYAIIEYATMAPEIHAALNNALNEVGQDVREMTLRRVLGKEKWGDIGTRFGMTEGGVRFKVNEALKVMRQMLREISVTDINCLYA